jgi:threonine/homoserine/homoserine lactone efflux protein
MRSLVKELYITMLEFLLQGISFAVAAVTLVGPLQTYAMSAGLNLGLRRGWIIGLAPIIMDIPIIIVIVFILGQFPSEWVRIIQIVGGIVLLWMAYGAWQQFKAGTAFGASAEGASAGITPLGVLRRAIITGMLSPGPYLFWGTVSGPLLLRGLSISLGHAGAFLLGFYSVFFLGLVGIVAIFDRLRLLSPRVTRMISLGTILLLVFFALSLIGQGLGIWGAA